MMHNNAPQMAIEWFGSNSKQIPRGMNKVASTK